MWWSRTRAAAMIAPIRQGQRLTRRSALNVTLSSELPRSANARVAACRALTVRSSSLSGRPVAFLTGVVRGGLLALVAQVAENGVGLVGPFGQGRQHLGVRAQAGGVVFPARPPRRGPDRPAVRSGHDLDVAAMTGVLARPPQVPPGPTPAPPQ